MYGNQPMYNNQVQYSNQQFYSNPVFDVGKVKDFTNKLIHSPDKADKFQQQKANCMIGSDYPYPIVSYPMMKMRALAMFKIIKE